MPVGLRSRVPAKITSSMRTPRRLLADCSPSTQEMESEMFDFPHPLGPTTAAMPSPVNFSSVRSQKDLNPRICSFFSLSNFLLLQEWPIVARLWLSRVRVFPLSGTSPPFQRRLLDEISLVPANVPRELSVVKSKAHNRLWIIDPDHMMSHTLCN